jgi:tetratricopeptide (TPR) repeat protein
MPTAIASPQIKARTPAVAVTVAPPGIQITTAQTSVAANPNDARAYMTLGDAYRAANQPNVALLAYNKATELDPQLAEAYLAMGALFVRLNALDRAANVYMRAVQNNPDNVDLRMALGDVYYRQEAWEKVKGVYEGVIAKNPASALAYARLGDYYYHQSQYVEATKSYTRALEIDSTLPEAHFGLGLMAEQRRLTEQARREFTVVVNSPRASDELRAQAQQHLDQLK